LRAAQPNLTCSLAATKAAKDQVLGVMRELNQLFQENMGVYSRLPTLLQVRVRDVGTKVAYLRGDVGSAEVRGLLEDYTKALDEFRKILANQPTQQAILDASLQGVIAAFREAYRGADIYKLSATDFNFIQLLLRSQENVYVTRDVVGAIKAFSRGTELLKGVPSTAQFVENAPYNALVETINYFMSEWSLRNLGRAIANDRLFLNNLKTNADSYKSMYKTPPPNMRNYAVVVDGLVNQYQQGLRLLRTYPMKN